MSFIHEALEKAQKEGKLKKFEYTKIDEETPLEPLELTVPHQINDALQILHEGIEMALHNCPSRVIAISSSTKGEGSSTISFYYSLLLSKNKNRVPKTDLSLSFLRANTNKMVEDNAEENTVLIDANLRHPTLHQFFNLERNQGLTDMIENNLNIETAIKSVEGSNLKIVTSGQAVENPAELFGSYEMKGLIENLKKKFHYIIFDLPPIVPYVDTLVLGKQVDGLVLVVHAGHTRREVVQSAKDKLIKTKVNILGVILNRRRFYIPEMIYNRL